MPILSIVAALGRPALAGFAALCFAALAAPGVSGAATLEGRVLDPTGEPIVGAMVTARRGEPFHDTTVFSDSKRRVPRRRLAHGDAVPRARSTHRLEGRLEGRGRSVRRSQRAAQLRYDARARDGSRSGRSAVACKSLVGTGARRTRGRERTRGVLVRQCTYCHQQGSPATRQVCATQKSGQKVLSLMARMGGSLSPELSATQIPGLFNGASYDSRPRRPAP